MHGTRITAHNLPANPTGEKKKEKKARDHDHGMTNAGNKMKKKKRRLVLDHTASLQSYGGFKKKPDVGD